MRDGSKNEIIGPNHDNNGPFTKNGKSGNFLHKNLDDTPGQKIKPGLIALFAACVYIIVSNMPETIRGIKQFVQFFKGKPKEVALFLAIVIIYAVIEFGSSEKSPRRAVTSLRGKIKLAFIRVMFVMLILGAVSLTPSDSQCRSAKHDPKLAKKVAKADRKVVITSAAFFALWVYCWFTREDEEVECSDE